MGTCSFCRELNTYKGLTEFTQVNCIECGYENVNYPIVYCPVCGTILNKYKKRIKLDEIKKQINWKFVQGW